MKQKMKFPVPSYNRTPNRTRTLENEQLDFGWSRGTLCDGRSYYAEYWNEFGLDMMTCYFSAIGLESMDVHELVKLLETESLIRVRKEASEKNGPNVTLAKHPDEAGQEMLIINVPISDEDDVWTECLNPVYGYGK